MNYSGPPTGAPPPPHWRPPMVHRPPPPRRLPAQDHARLDAAERVARWVTWGMAGGAGMIALMLLCALAGRIHS